MIETTVAPRVVRPLTEAEKVAQLKSQRARLMERIAHAHEQRLFYALRNPDQSRAWAVNAKSLEMDLEMLDGDLAHYATPRSERYADVRAQMQYEDRTREVVSDGSTDWENA